MTTRDLLAIFGRLPPRQLELAIRCLCLALLLGLTIKSAMLAHWGLVAVLLVLFSFLLLNTFAPLWGRAAPIPVQLLMLALVVTVLVTTFYLGLSGAIWTFPALVGLRYAGPKARTGALRWALVLFVPMLVAWHGDLPNALRLFAAASISALYLWLAEGQVVSLQARLDQDEGRDPLTRAYLPARLQKDLHRIPDLAPVSMLLLRIDGLLTLREQTEGTAADEVLRRVAHGVLPLLSARERLYRLGNDDLLIGFAGWRAYECYELGEQLRRVLHDRVPEGLTLQVGVAEVSDTEGFPSALDTAYAQLSDPKGPPPPFTPL